MSPGPRLAPLLILVGGCSGDVESAADAAEGLLTAARSTPIDGEDNAGVYATPATPRLRFTDVTVASGLGDFHQSNGSAEKLSIVESVGAGVAFLDADGDGWLDVYLTNGGRAAEAGGGEAGVPRDALFRNDSGKLFVDVTADFRIDGRAWTNGVRTADLDGDGWTDLYLTNHGPNTLLANRGGQHFEDVTERSGAGDPRWSTGALFFDFERDGDLDLYVGNYVDVERDAPPPAQRQYKGLPVFAGPHGLPGARDTFYLNAGDGRFEDRTEALGAGSATGFAFQAVAFDADEDGWMDVYVANDSMPNVLWRNVEGRKVEDIAPRVGLSHGKSGKAQAGMGIAVGDVNGDGRLDLYTTNFSEDYNTLYENLGRGLFADVTMRYGLGMVSWERLGWACGFVDFDNDADLDLFCVNGHVFPQVDGFDSGTRYAQANQLFENVGPGRFAEVTGEDGAGFGGYAASRGGAWADYDEDGDLDLLVGNLDGPPTLLRNDTTRLGGVSEPHAGGAGEDTPRAGWVRFEFVAREGHPAALGVDIEVETDLGVQRRVNGEGSGFLSSNDPRLHVGLGAARELREVRVRWPSGHKESFRDLPVGCTVRLVEGEGTP